MRDIGKNMRSARIRKNMTQDELAEKLFVTRQTVSNYETGRSRPDIEILMNTAEVLGVELNELLYGIEISPERKRELRRFVISSLIIAFVWTAVLVAIPHLKSIAATRYLFSGLYLVRIFVVPALCFALGGLAISACGLFLGAKPLQFALKGKLRNLALVLLVVFLVLLLPMLVSLIGLAIEEIKILLTDGPNSLSWSLGGNIPIISKISANICLFMYRFPYAAIPFGVIPWLLKTTNKKEPR